jgi:hypothetical protein
LSAAVASIYKAVQELEAEYPGRKFTPDGHLVGSIGEVVAAKALGLTLYPMSRARHDAFDSLGDVQIKLTAGKSVAMYTECIRLVVLRVVSPEEAEIVYDGPGAPVWACAGKIAKTASESSAWRDSEPWSAKGVMKRICQPDPSRKLVRSFRDAITQNLSESALHQM